MMTKPVSNDVSRAPLHGAALPPGHRAALIEAETTHMFREAGTAGAAVRMQFETNRAAMTALGAKLRELAPRAVVTCARGSSDHAATFAKYLIETRIGVLTASAAPSVSSVYGVQQDLRQCLFLAISQSGQSPDLVASAQAARAAGATVVALVNADAAPLSEIADFAIPLCAGPEQSVAATKSYIASLFAIAHLVAEWTGNAELLNDLAAAPEKLADAWTLDWSAAIPHLVGANHLYVIGRGIGLGIAQEAALKCKETCALHAEAFSGAEVRHGPQALLHADFPALIIAQDDETHTGMETLAGDLAARGVDVLLAGGVCKGALVLPTIAAHPVLQPLLIAQSFYRLANALSVARGRDPDRPPHLRKVTETF